MRKFLTILVIASAAVIAAIAVALPFCGPAIGERVLAAKLHELGVEAAPRLKLGYAWRNGPGIVGTLELTVRDSPWRLQAQFGASLAEYSARFRLDETAFDEHDACLRRFLPAATDGGLTNLAFSGRVSAAGEVSRTFRRPYPAWSAHARLRNVTVTAAADGHVYSLTNLQLTAAATGIADHYDIAPLRPRVQALSAAGFTVSNLVANIRVEPQEILVTEATAGLAGGKLNLYAAAFRPESRNTTLTLFLDDVDTGEILPHLSGFSGEASGHLHGKLKLHLREGGKAVRLGDAFLYSTPGETGHLRLENPAAIEKNLALAGLDGPTRAQVADALTDLDYSALRLDLRRTQGGNARLSTRIAGTAQRGALKIPVDLTVNFNGALEALINTSLDCQRLKKGK